MICRERESAETLKNCIFLLHLPGCCLPDSIKCPTDQVKLFALHLLLSTEWRSSSLPHPNSRESIEYFQNWSAHSDDIIYNVVAISSFAEQSQCQHISRTAHHSIVSSIRQFQCAKDLKSMVKIVWRGLPTPALWTSSYS